MTLRTRPIAVLVLTAAIGLGPSSAGNPDPYEGAVRFGRNIVERVMLGTRTPGLAIAVAVDDAIVWSEAFGLASVELNVPATPLTKFRIASISKLLTGTAVAKLVED